MAEPLSKEMRATRDALRTPAKREDGVIRDTVPAVRKGESVLSSRPFSLLRLMGAKAGIVDPDRAKNEIELIGRFNKALDETNCKASNTAAGTFFYPGQRSFLNDDAQVHPAMQELQEATSAVGEADPDEVGWLAERTGRVRKGYGPRYVKTAMSYLTDTSGGSLIPPPEMGELIPLMRNKSALDRAGARQVPLPPNGKWVAPRVTGASDSYWIGENTAPTESNLTTGQASMQAKKLAVLVRVPNELFKFTSAGADALLRDDVVKTLSLRFDRAALYGGGGGEPKGIINYTDTNEVLFYDASTPTPGGVGSNGNTLMPEDGYRMSASIADRNFDNDGTAFKWIMRPKMWGGIASRRSDAVTAGDAQGLFVQTVTRALGDRLDKSWCNHEVVQSAQVRNNQTKGGSGATLTEVFGGVWDEFLMGIYGAIEFASNPMGDTSFQQDQTLIRGILHADCVPRYPGAIVCYKELILN